MSSRLFQSIREEHGLAYSIYSTPNFYHDTGSLTIAAGLDTSNTQKALALTMTELRRLREKAPTTSELRRARDYLIGQMELSLESTENQMNWVAEQLLGLDKIIPPDQIGIDCTKFGPATSAAPLRIFFPVRSILPLPRQPN